MTYRYSLLSDYRSTLMGIAISGVMLAHSVSWAGNPLGLERIVDPFARLVFTEGFLFLSGLGLYYSFSKNNELCAFYKKRILRLLVPFMLIALPFYLIPLVEGEDNLGIFLMKETSLYFFFYGNNGMWYISLSILLYLLFPLFHKFMFQDSCNKGIIGRIIILTCTTIAFNYILMYGCNEYYAKIEIGINKTPMFILGIGAGYLAHNSLPIGNRHLIIIILLTILLYLCKEKIPKLPAYSEQTIRICGMLGLSIFFNKYKSQSLTSRLKRMFDWFGKYTLELYILHMLNYNLLRHITYDWMILPESTGLNIMIVSINLAISIALAKNANKVTNHITLGLQNINKPKRIK